MRHPCLLDDVGEVLEADEGKEGEQPAESDAGQRGGVQRRQRGDRSQERDIVLDGGNDDNQQSSDFNQRKDAGHTTDFRMPHDATAPSSASTASAIRYCGSGMNCWT